MARGKRRSPPKRETGRHPSARRQTNRRRRVRVPAAGRARGQIPRRPAGGRGLLRQRSQAATPARRPGCDGPAACRSSRSGDKASRSQTDRGRPRGRCLSRTPAPPAAAVPASRAPAAPSARVLIWRRAIGAGLLLVNPRVDREQPDESGGAGESRRQPQHGGGGSVRPIDPREHAADRGDRSQQPGVGDAAVTSGERRGGTGELFDARAVDVAG